MLKTITKVRRMKMASHNELDVPPPKHISLSRVSSLDVSSTNSSKQGSAAGWKVLRESVARWILKAYEADNIIKIPILKRTPNMPQHPNPCVKRFPNYPKLLMQIN